MSSAFGRRFLRQAPAEHLATAEALPSPARPESSIVARSPGGIRHVIVTRGPAIEPPPTAADPEAATNSIAATNPPMGAAEELPREGAAGGVVTGLALPAWAAGLALLGVTATALVFFVLHVPPPASLIIVAFVLTCPGVAILRLLGLSEPLLVMVAGVALSAAMFGLLTVGQLYLGQWSPGASFLVLVIVTVLGTLADPAIVPRSVMVAAVDGVAGPMRRLRGRLAAFAASLVRSARSRIDAARAEHQGQATDLPQPRLAHIREPQATEAPKTYRRRSALGWDPLEQSAPTKPLRTTIERVVDDLADEKDERDR